MVCGQGRAFGWGGGGQSVKDVGKKGTLYLG